MNNIYVDLRQENDTIKKIFNGVDMVTIDDLLSKIEEIHDDLEYTIEQFEDYKQNIEDNYRPITSRELYGDYEDFRIESGKLD